MQITRAQARDELDTSTNPVFLFDDDCDGLCSFLLLWRYLREGKGFVVKGRPLVDLKYARKIEENGPDKVFVLDVPEIGQDFLDAAHEMGAPVVWIDHHPPVERNYVKHFNPRYKGESRPTSQLCYEIVENEKDKWIAATGTVSDWMYTDFVRKFSERNPGLISPEAKTAEAALFDTRLGMLARILSFNMKGKLSDVMKSIKALTRIAGPEEILSQQSEGGKFIYRRFELVDRKYGKLLAEAKRKRSRDEMLVYIYSDDEWSLTKDLSNEMVYRNPDKVVIIGRQRNGEAKMSIRSVHHVLPPIIQKALAGVEGYGGGHEHACGANVKSQDLERFLRQFREEIEKEKKRR
jgi:single-stranded DNA-specific DHH superfamily exonuclease